ncbi:MAG: sulfotransferase [Desulfobulbaceae bacterium]|nr:sulfotransferase [Desulfobulbaceae bacterium]
MNKTTTTQQSPPEMAAMTEADRLLAAGNPAAAEGVYRRLLVAAPDFHPAWHALGLLACRFGKLPLAADLIGKAVAIDNGVALYHRNLCEIRRRLGRLAEAITAGEQATTIAPNDRDAHYNLGLAYTDSGRQEEASRCYRRALELTPDHNLSWNNLGASLEKLGDKAGAEEAYARAIAIAPGHAEAQNNLGAIYSEQGRLAEACRAFEAAIAARPDFVEAHYNLSSLKNYTPGDPHLAALETVATQAIPLPVPARVRYNFALGKAREDVGDYDRAFAAYAEGNRLQHDLQPYDEAQAEAICARIKEVFDRDFLAKTPSPAACGQADKTPVFIVGMPRSGTTLIEHILASHPSVYGAGELIDLHEVIHAAPGAIKGQPFTAWAPRLTDAELAAMGDRYLQRVWRLRPEARYITDKMPANFFYIGLLRRMLPGARIIHAVRDPMDSCFSCFTRLFNDTMAFAYDLDTLGRYYVRYTQLMGHWHELLPAGAILDVRYEEMVADVEGQTRRMLAHLDLPWDDACLAFYNNRRPVKTASVAQVRRPIYTTSVARWQRFAPHLGRLLDIVKDYRVQD